MGCKDVESLHVLGRIVGHQFADVKELLKCRPDFGVPRYGKKSRIPPHTGDGKCGTSATDSSLISSALRFLLVDALELILLVFEFCSLLYAVRKGLFKA